MKIVTKIIEISTSAENDIVNITTEVQNIVVKCGLNEGCVLVFGVGSTIGIGTIEYEPGLIVDYPALLNKLIPFSKNYHHNQTWGDDNGHSHLRATLQGSSISIPFYNRELLLGIYQQIVAIEFDTRERNRKIVVQVTGI